MTSTPTVGHAMRAYLAGTETFVHNQIVALRRYRPVVVAHHRRPASGFELTTGAIAQEHLPRPVATAEDLAYRALRVALPPGNRALARYLRAEDVRLLHFHFLTDARFLRGVARRIDVPAIVSGYGYDVSAFPSRWHGLGRRYLRSVFDRIAYFLAMTEDMQRDMIALGCPPDRVLVHYHGSNTARFRMPARDYERGRPLTVLCCARLEPRKGQDLVLRALRRLDDRGHPRVRVVLVGDGPLRGELERLVAEYGWRDRVTLTGHVPHQSEALVRHYAEADVFVHPSVTRNGLKEGIPGTIVEAMASGLPVVATHHAGIPSVIDSGREGLLVREGDAGELADAIEAVLDDAALRAELGRAAAARAERDLDLVACTAKLELIYDRVARS